MTLNTRDFAEFFRACHGDDPFPWQMNLAARVLAGQGWPEAIGLPTAAGKTAVLDIAVFTLAASVGQDRRPFRRIIYVVDRRLVVDSVYERAARVSQLLREEARRGSRSVVGQVAQALLDLARRDVEEPLQVVRLRGGGFLEREWARTPAQPVVVVSTVDQVGSRLLFRGYGLARDTTNELSVHAGLLGCDAILFLDEAHLSQPFLQTLQAVREYRDWSQYPVGGPWQVVALSATPRDGGGGPSALAASPEDVAHPKLGRRLRASKLATLRKVAKDSELAPAMVEEAERLALWPGVRVVAIIANRVLRARHAFEELRRRGRRAILLTGRVRPLDRDRALRGWLGHIQAGRSRDQTTEPLFVVATQTIEVGADLDFDGMVTEAASLDALRQRLGRLDRLGELGESHVVIVASEEQLARKASDPIYGQALRETWALLEKAGGRSRTGKAARLDLGWAAFQQLLGDSRAWAKLCAPAREAPVLLPSHIDLLAQTSPVPHPDPDVGVLLHGANSSPADVRLVWRADLAPDHPDDWKEIVALCPPRSGEALELPVWTVRRWLEGYRPDASDVEGVSLDDSEDRRQSAPGRPCLRWTDSDTAERITPDEIRPGDTLVVPAHYGGCDEFGWAPDSREPVPDLAEHAAEGEFLRLHPETLKSWLPREVVPPAHEALESLREVWQTGDDTADQVRDLLEILASQAADDRIRSAAAVSKRRRLRLLPYPDGRGFVVLGPMRAGSADRSERSHSVGRPVLLRDHSQGVADRARHYASALGLPDHLVEDLGLAGEVHDLGKADPRFQMWLQGGDPEAVSAGDPLAKSGMDPRNRAWWRRARERAGYPAGARHEALSVALASHASMLAKAHDRDLVLHLVGSHHGAARPFFAPVQDPHPPLVEIRWDGHHLQASAAHGLERLGSGVAERFWRLVQRYGWWGLAYLEAILRLADWRQSEAEQEDEA